MPDVSREIAEVRSRIGRLESRLVVARNENPGIVPSLEHSLASVEQELGELLAIHTPRPGLPSGKMDHCHHCHGLIHPEAEHHPYCDACYEAGHHEKKAGRGH